MKIKIFLLALTLPISCLAQTQDTQQASINVSQPGSPEFIVKDISLKTLEYVKSSKDLKSGNIEPFILWANSNVVNDFDFNKMTSLALGKSWRLASKEQKIELSHEFQTLLLRTFARSFSGVTVNQEIQFKGVISPPNSNNITVKTLIIKPGTKPLDVNYSLEKIEGRWYIYDISLAGISLITNYRDSFAQEVSNGGIEGLISVLKTKNSKIT